MRKAFHAFFNFFATLFVAANRGASTLDNYAKWAEAESGAFELEARLERDARLAALSKELGIDLKVVEAKSAAA
ncbi:MAG: hypothetical protein VR73_05500 [Gammaproteobacteria bacterium BRH_c0]|nr:MAG: hypothetical protein VR73_05500 [Gammaproteobacteria bacterium BRH_c0]